MRDCLLTLLYLTVMVAKLRGPGGTRAVIAECLDRIVPLGESHLRTAVRASWITIRGTTASGFPAFLRMASYVLVSMRFQAVVS
jgi:hypothetical protein